MLDRDTVIKRAIDECYAELYMNAQPKVDFKQLVEDAKAGIIKGTSLKEFLNELHVG